ncbi:hypothetical protein M998_1821 [Providencia heimbachae ATCC 35613]|uniref:Uncharacterized protein n=1 Tax=Providencia heimbachae ATCC 35613 TaxID=1354272 RepID=A0A1B7JV98_9GAMM|nr:hypothetical protein M998_1821 [Providencia heimbachae ATCC 35613]
MGNIIAVKKDEFIEKSEYQIKKTGLARLDIDALDTLSCMIVDYIQRPELPI